MKTGEWEDIYLIEPRKIAETINSRSPEFTSDFSLWLDGEEYVITDISSQIPGATLLYTGRGWGNAEGDRVDEEWVLNNIDIPEEVERTDMHRWRKAA